MDTRALPRHAANLKTRVKLSTASFGPNQPIPPQFWPRPITISPLAQLGPCSSVWASLGNSTFLGIPERMQQELSMADSTARKSDVLCQDSSRYGNNAKVRL